MDIIKTRWVTSEGVFLCQEPDISSILNDETIMLLSSSLYAINVFFNTNQIQFNKEQLSIVRINFHPPLSTEDDQAVEDHGYIIHSSFNKGISTHSIFIEDTIENQRSEFEKVFLDSVATNVIESVTASGREIRDLPFIQTSAFQQEIREQLSEIDANYNSLLQSWEQFQLAQLNSRFVFGNVLYNGKIGVEELFYDLGERAIESFNMLLMSKEEKIVLYKIAKALVGLSGLIYDKENTKDDFLNFVQSEIILESSTTKKLFRLDIRSYDIEGAGFCDLTILSN